jgi:uncharacterized protein (TIGR02246 family)
MTLASTPVEACKKPILRPLDTPRRARHLTEQLFHRTVDAKKMRRRCRNPSAPFVTGMEAGAAVAARASSRGETMEARLMASDAEQAIRDALDAWQRAVLDADLDRTMSFYAPDVVAYDAVDKLRFEGRDAYRGAWEKGFSCVPEGGRMIFELGPVTVAAGEGVGFTHGLVRCGMADADGAEQSGWMRYTGCWRREGDRWLIAHEHFSVPFSMDGDPKPLFHLEP